MPVSLSEWRVRIGTFVHWIREYEVNERRERLLKERIRRLKVLCERLEAKRGDSGEVFEDDKSRQDDPDPKGCPHKTANIRSSGNSSDIKELLTSCDQCIQDLLTASDSHIKEILTPSGSSIKELITPNECSIRSLNSLNGPTIKDIITPNDSGIKELVSTNDSRIKNLVKSNDDSRIQDLVKANDDSRIQDLLTSNYSSTGTCIRNPITPRYCSIKDVIVSRNADSQPLDTPNDSSTKELTSLNVSSIKDLITPNDSSIIDLITSEYSNVKELITSNDSKIDSLLSPNKTNIKQLIQPDDDYIEEQLARKCTLDDESIEHDTQVGDSEEQHMSDFSISPRHSLSDASVMELLTSSNSSMKELRTPTDDLNAYLIIKTSNIKDHETQSDGSVNELPSPGSGTTLCRPFAPCDDLLVELLKPTVSASKDLPSIDFCCHEPDRQNEPFSEKSRKLPHFMGKDHYPQPDTFTKEATDDEVLKEHHKSSGSCKSQTETSILMAFERSPVVVPFISRKYCISDRYGEKQVKESASSCHGPSSESTTDLISGQIPPLSELLLLKSGDVELNPGPREAAGWSLDLEREMLILVQDVPLRHYCILCNALDVSYAQSKKILSENFNNVPASLYRVICNWGSKQKDDTKCRRLLAEKLRSVHLDALGTKLVEGGYSKQDTPTQSSVTDEVHPVNKLTQKENIRAGRRSDLDKELLSLVEDVSPVHYLDLCNALDVSNLQSQLLLTQNLMDVSNSLLEVINRWRLSQRPGTNYKRLLADKLRSVHLDALATKLVKGGYSSQDTPTQSSVTDEVHPENEQTQDKDFRAVWGLDFERELLYLVQDVSPVHYYALCKALYVSDKKSQIILTQNHFDVSHSLFEVICRWRVNQRDGTSYKRLLAEKLRSVHLDELATKLVKGGYSTHDTPTQSLVADEVHGVNKLTQEEVIRAWWSSDLEKELLSLIKDVSPVHYYDLCKALDISDKQSNVILTQNLMDVSNSLYEVIYSWRVKQRDGTNYKRFLAEKLRTVQLDALATKLVEGGYSTHGSPTQSSVADEVHPVNKLTQEESLLFEEALMARKESPTEESEKPVESVDDDERVNCFGFTEELSVNLLDTKVLTINVEAPEEHEDLTAFPKKQELQYHPELAEEPQYHPPITSWTWNEGQDRTILDLQQSNLPLREVMSCVAQSCPKLHTLRLHANVPVLISEESILESDSTTSVDESDKEDSPEIEIYMRCRQTTDVPFRALLAIVSSIFPKICDLTLDGDDETKLDISGYTQPLPSSFLPKLRRLCLQQLMGSLCLLTFLKFVVEQLSHLPFLRISQCNVDVQTEIEMEFSESALSHLEIIPVNVIPFACLNKLVFKAFKSITNFIVQHNIAAEHHIYLNWTKTGQMPTEKLYLKQSTPLRAFKDILTIVKKFPRISKLETDECGSFERTELLEIVRTCTQLQYFSSVASGVSRILAISHQFMRKSTSKPISKSFGKLGGELRLETHDITLCVPEGAIQEEGEIQIILQALINPPSTHFQEDEMVCSFGFQCTIPNSPGFRFAVPVRVTLPHCAILHDPSKVRTGIYHGELWHDTGDVEISTITYVPPSENRLPRCEVDEKEITVIIDHFSFEWPVLNIRNPFVKGKRLGCMPFVPKKMPPTKKPILRVYLFDIVRGNPEEIEKDESKCDFRMARPKIELQARDDLVVTCGMDGSNDHDNKPEQSLRTILFSDIRQLIQNTVDFRLDFSQRVEQFASVNLSLTEGTRNRGNLSFDIDFTGGDTSGSSRDARADKGLTSDSTSQLVMADILTDKFVLTLSQKIDPGQVTAQTISICLGLSRAKGSGAAIQANVDKNQHYAFEDLLCQYVLRNGRNSKSALNLRRKFLENGMKEYADVIKAELEKFRIPVPSDKETLKD